MVDIITGFLTYQIGGITLEDYMLASIVFAASLLLLRFFKMVVVHRLKKLAEKTETKLDDLGTEILNGLGWPLYTIISLAIGLFFIDVPAKVDKTLFYALIIVLTFYAVKSLQKLIDFGTQLAIEKRKEEGESEGDTAVIDLLGKVIKIALWVVAGVLIIGNLGYDVSTLVAGLGVGGIAIAFALQNILQDIFASFSIYFDKPFKVGHFIKIGDDKGTVKTIGIKSTRLQTLDGEELVVSNRELTESRVRNYKKMVRRRASFSFGVACDTPVMKLKKIPGIVTKIIEKQEKAVLDRVHFTELGDFSLNFEVVYYMKTKDYMTYRNTQQTVNLELIKAFEKEKIVFPFPTQTVYVKKG